MDLRSDRPGDSKPAPKLVVIDTKARTFVSMVGKEVADRVALGPEIPQTDEDYIGFRTDLENFRLSAVPGTNERWVREEEVFRARYGYAQDEMESWMKSLNP